MSNDIELDIATIKQGLPVIAEVIKCYFDSLIQQGFENKEAIYLTGVYSTNLINGGKNESN